MAIVSRHCNFKYFSNIIVVLILNCLSFHNIWGKEFTSCISEGINDYGIKFSTQLSFKILIIFPSDRSSDMSNHYARQTVVFSSISPQLSSPFLHSLQTFHSNTTCVARVHKNATVLQSTCTFDELVVVFSK